jgi:hypothetical protein
MSLGALAAVLALLVPLPSFAGSPGPAKSPPSAPSAKAPAATRSPASGGASSGAPQTTAPAAARVTKDRVTKDDGYSYAFGDDPLQGAGYDAASARIAVRRGHVRGLLIRPRIQFVDAMLKSVENI